MFHNGHGGQKRTGTDRFSETKNKEMLTVISPDQPTDNLEMIYGGQDKIETNMVSDTKISPEQPRDNLEMIHGGHNKTETNLVSDTENILTVITLEQTSTDQLMDKAYQTSTDQLMDKAYQTSIDQLMDKAYQTCTDQLMDKAYHTREKVDAGNECGKEYQEGVLTKDKLDELCFKEWIRICKALVKVLIIMIMMIMDCYSNMARNIAGTTIRSL
ncbi:unnamed protein product [Mytilus coruscus]|uniref:Uncharacterized protein n=1 Tax=Mytilus coruscus TaxID=42192 RepID=A0A6J8EZZ0_MYTCO|nr:unnamed protein product [Mytilus coruscus]